MTKRKTIVQEILEHPIYVGGYVWSRIFLMRRLREDGFSESNIHIFLTAAQRTPAPAEPDTRDIPEEKALSLWKAMRECDLETIGAIFSEFWEIKVPA